jgi:hypothetical protein
MSDPPSSQSLQCPACGNVIEIACAWSSDWAAGFITCPHCHADLLLPDPQQQASTQMDAPESPEPQAGVPGGALDGLRIQRLATMRRATYRSRSYALVAAGGCAVAAVQLAVSTVRQVLAAGWSTRAVAYALLAMLAGCAAVWFWGRAAKLSSEIRRSISSQADDQPDLSAPDDRAN